MNPTLLWFRQDLRLDDNPALRAALERGGPVIPVFVLDDESEGRWRPGAAARGWLHHSLAALDASLRQGGSRLVFRRGHSAEIVSALAAETGATAVYWNRRYEPDAVRHEARIADLLTRAGIELKRFDATLLHEPEQVANKEGRPFQVFTPFWRHCLELTVQSPWKFVETAIPAPSRWPACARLEELELLPTSRWDGGFGQSWTPGETGAKARLRQFVRSSMESYATARDRPALAGTSLLSPHLHFGEIGPRQIWSAVAAVGRDRGVFPPGKGAAVFLSELGWREFAYHLLFHFPQTPEQPLRPAFARFPWADDPGGEKLHAWQRGRTGYPIVDAGMRQLWQTGWMHNRLRMITASFLVKHLRLPWTGGAAWFWETLVDADLANNTLGWQWSAGCGADAAPYFRIFAPVLQSRKFDAAGEYVRRWVPELARLSAKHLHAPWEAPEAVLADAGIRLGETYPRPIVEHTEARKAALAAFQSLKVD